MGPRGPVITIDGPAGAGKTTVARLLAERLGYELIPTGAMYRALALSVLRAGVSVEDPAALARHLAPIEVTVVKGRVLLDGVDVTGEIRSQAVADLTSTLSMRREVRDKVTPLQRRAAEPGGVVLEGRDTGTIVCPRADVKFFLTASLESRARRRHAELAAQGIAADLDTVREEMKDRDRQDTTRALAPLVKAPDALEIDTSALGIEQVVERMEAAIRARQAEAPRSPFYAAMKLLAVAVIVGAGAFAYVSRVNDDVDRKEEAAQILARMQTSTARLGNLAALMEARARLGSRTPSVRWIVVAMRRNLRELADVVRLAHAHGVGAVFAPAHAAAFETIGHHRLARALDRSRADLPAVGPIVRIVHAMVMVAEVADALRMRLAR